MSRRILVVDDNPDAGLMLALVLRRAGHDVQVAPDGPTAVTLYGRHRPDVVLCDIGMPGMDGYEVARAIRRLSPPSAPRPVLIALTGSDHASDRSNAFAAGFDHHVLKPGDIVHLTRLMQPDARPAPTD